MAIDDYLDMAGVAKLLGISLTSAHDLTKRQTLPYTWVANRKVVKRSAVIALRDDPGYRSRSRRPGGPAGGSK